MWLWLLIFGFQGSFLEPISRLDILLLLSNGNSYIDQILISFFILWCREILNLRIFSLDIKPICWVTCKKSLKEINTQREKKYMMSLQPWNLEQPDSSTYIVFWNIKSNGPKTLITLLKFWCSQILIGWIKPRLTQPENVSVTVSHWPLQRFICGRS